MRLAAVFACLVAFPASALAQEPAAPTTGIERPEILPEDTVRGLASYALFVPRKTVEIFFVASGAAADIVQDQQVVPRVRELIAGGDGILVFPTAFAETGRTPSIGARMIAKAGGAATSFRAGYGGPDEVVFESKLRWSFGSVIPTALALEALYDQRTDLEYRGLGQVPGFDPRNPFTGPLRVGLYHEKRSRLIGSVGIRPADDVELFLSASFLRYRIDDAAGSGPAALSRVFDRSALVGTYEPSGTFYGELALRLDTRAERGRPSPGSLIESYAGTARGLPGGDEVHFLRWGGRAAVFIPVLRASNILSPKLAADVVSPVGGLQVPFTELAGQPEFRGQDNRRDFVSLVGSIDYRWTIARFAAARVFADAATVASGPGSIALADTRFAGGVGLDFFTSSTELGRIAVSGSPEGFNAFVSFGVPSDFGDRQHRD